MFLLFISLRNIGPIVKWKEAKPGRIFLPSKASAEKPARPPARRLQSGCRMCIFIPMHTPETQNPDAEIREEVFDPWKFALPAPMTWKP